MSIRAYLLASGEGWHVHDVRCTYGPHDKPFEEQHKGIRIALVKSGTFTYRTAQGATVLAPGSALLGNHGQCFECGHEHAVGDRCISFRFSPEFVEGVMRELPGVDRLSFALPSLPPRPELIPVMSGVEAARLPDAEVSYEELALSLLAKVGTLLATLNSSARSRQRARDPNKRDRQRVTDALRRIESEHDRSLPLQELARAAAMSPYHFLRTFRDVAGVTPHQFLLHTRLQRAAARLRASNDKISVIALDAGFSDLSTFNRRFRRLLGATPRAYRAGRATED